MNTNTGLFMPTSNTCINFEDQPIYINGTMVLVRNGTNGQWHMFSDEIMNNVCNGNYNDGDQPWKIAYNFSAFVTC